MKLVDLFSLHAWPLSLLPCKLAAFLCILAIRFEFLELSRDVFHAEVVVDYSFFVEIESPDFGNLAFRLGELLVVLADVELLLDREQVLHCMEVVATVVENASDVEDCHCPLVVVLFLCEAATLVF